MTTTFNRSGTSPALIDVWSWSLDRPPSGIPDPTTLLSPDETARAARFARHRDAHRYIVGRSTLRIVLASYLDRHPEELVFAYNEFGKPCLGEEDGSDLHFNLSHSEDIAVLAVSDRFPLGIDIEAEKAIAEDVAGHFFSPNECIRLKSLPISQQQQAFYRCWTRKEAFVKAHGAGLSLALDCFDVPLVGTESLRIERLDDTVGLAGDWSLLDLRVPQGFFGAVAAMTEGASVALRYRPDNP